MIKQNGDECWTTMQERGRDVWWAINDGERPKLANRSLWHGAVRWTIDDTIVIRNAGTREESIVFSKSLTIPPKWDNTHPQGWIEGKTFWMNVESSQVVVSTSKFTHFTNQRTTGIMILPSGLGIYFLSRISSGSILIIPSDPTSGKCLLGITWGPTCCLS